MTKEQFIESLESLLIREGTTPDTTYGDTELQAVAVYYGWNQAMELVIARLKKAYIDDHPDTEADGWVFCGKCGAAK